MKKNILTISILANILNCPLSFADKASSYESNKQDQEILRNHKNRSIFFGIIDFQDQNQLQSLEEAVLKVSNSNYNTLSADEIDRLLRTLKFEVEILDELYFERSVQVKELILAIFLKSNIILLDTDDHFKLDLSPSIIEKLEEREILNDIYAKPGVICF